MFYSTIIVLSLLILWPQKADATDFIEKYNFRWLQTSFFFLKKKIKQYEDERQSKKNMLQKCVEHNFFTSSA